MDPVERPATSPSSQYVAGLAAGEIFDRRYEIVRLLGSGIPEGKLWDGHYMKLRNGSERALARLKMLLEKKVSPPTPATSGPA